MRILLALWIAAVAVTSQGADRPHTVTVNGQRPLVVHTPQHYDPSEPLPLLLLLHGYAASGEAIENYFRFKPLIDQQRFLYAHPDGTRTDNERHQGQRGWNAGPVFGNVYGHQSDDIDYLGQVLDAIEARYKVAKVFVVGHSNGGRMTYGLVCAYGHRIAAAVSLAGTLLGDPVTRCGRSAPEPSPTHILHIHGTEDRVTTYTSGGLRNYPHPGALGAAERWARYNGCESRAESLSERLDIGAREPGPETQIVRYRHGCRFGGSAELWTIEGGNHMPALVKTDTEGDADPSTRLAKRLLDWLFARAADSESYQTAARATK